MRKSPKKKSAKKLVDVEALALEAKIKRQTTCSDEINTVLEKHKCQLTVHVTLGNQSVPLAEVVRLPLTLDVVSR